MKFVFYQQYFRALLTHKLCEVFCENSEQYSMLYVVYCHRLIKHSLTIITVEILRYKFPLTRGTSRTGVEITSTLAKT